MPRKKEGTIPVKDALEIATKVVNEQGLNVSPEEVVDYYTKIGIEDVGYIANILSYAKYRIIDRMGMVKAFRKAFPLRSVVRGDEIGSIAEKGIFSAGHKKPGEPLDDSTIKIKAKRIEATKTYASIVSMLETPLHIMYAIKRMEVLEKAFEIALDDGTNTRDRHQYMKLFLEETRKPADAKAFELQVNLTQNNVSINQIESKLENIAESLLTRGSDASSIIDAITVKPTTPKPAPMLSHTQSEPTDGDTTHHTTTTTNGNPTNHHTNHTHPGSSSERSERANESGGER